MSFYPNLQTPSLGNAVKEFSEGTSIATEQIRSWGALFISKLEFIFIAIFIFVLFFILARIVGRYTDRLMGRFSTSNLAVNKIISALVSVFVMMVGLFIALAIVGLDKAVTSMLAGAGLIGLALGFAFQNIIINFISGIIIAFRTPIKLGEIIDTNGLFGIVRHIDFRATTIESATGEKVVIPNRLVLENPLTNFSRYGTRRVDLKVGISYNEDLPKVEKVVRAAIEKMDGLVADKPIEVFYEGFGDSSINFVTRFWIPYHTQGQYMDAQSRAIMNIHKAFSQADIEIPFPIRTIYNRD